MKRRHIIFIIIAALLLPQFAFGEDVLKHPQGGSNMERSTILEDRTLNSAAPDSTETVYALSSGREYTLEISNWWQPTGDANNFADAAFETTSGFDSDPWIKTGKGIVFAGKSLHTLWQNAAARDPSLPSQLLFRSDHTYQVNFVGRGIKEEIRISDPVDGIAGNSGSLRLKIYQRPKASWIYAINQEITLGIPGVPSKRLRVDPITTQTVDNQEITATTTVQESHPAPYKIEFDSRERCEGGAGQQTYMKIYVGGSQVGPNIPVGPCLGFFERQATFTFESGNKVPNEPVTVSQSHLCNMGMTSPNSPTATSCGLGIPPALDFGDSPGSEPQYIGGLEPGSSIELQLSWTADLTRLWRSPFNDRDPDTGKEHISYWAPYNPFSAADYFWYSGEVAKGNLGLTAKIVVYGPGKKFITSSCLSTPGVGNVCPTIPGAGQIIESMFANTLDPDFSDG